MPIWKFQIINFKDKIIVPLSFHEGSPAVLSRRFLYLCRYIYIFISLYLISLSLLPIFFITCCFVSEMSKILRKLMLALTEKDASSVPSGIFKSIFQICEKNFEKLECDKFEFGWSWLPGRTGILQSHLPVFLGSLSPACHTSKLLSQNMILMIKNNFCQVDQDGKADLQTAKKIIMDRNL